jgi:glycosyltransferase involved in cell wall biosynthesis
LNFGGAEDVLLKLAFGLDRDRFEVQVCSTLGLGPMADRLRSGGVTVQPAGPKGRAHNYLRAWHVHRVVRRFKPDVVHSHGLPPLGEVGQVARVGPPPRWIHTFHFGNYPHTEKRRHMHVERLFSGGPDQLVAVSDKQRADLIRYHRIAPARILTVLNGVDPNVFVDDGRTRRETRAELGIGPDEFVVGTVAVLTEQKGITYLLKAARRLLDTRPGIRLVIVGGGPLEGALHREAEALGLGSGVIFTSWRSDATRLLCAFDAYAMASLWEAMPIALLEAMAAGRPIVVTDVGQNARLVEDQQSAIVIPPADADAIVTAVMALRDDPARAARLGARARERVEALYSTRKMVHEYERLYTETPRRSFRPARMLARAARW